MKGETLTEHSQTFGPSAAELRLRYAGLLRGLSADRLNVPPGWARIVQRLCAVIEASLTDETRALFHCTEIGERHGVLRFGWDLDLPPGRGEELWQQIHWYVLRAEQEAQRTCQCCGGAGETRRNNHRVMTTCADCEAAFFSGA